MTTDWSNFGRKFLRRVSKLKELVRREEAGSMPASAEPVKPAEPTQALPKDSQSSMIKPTDNADAADIADHGSLGSQAIDIGKQQLGAVYAKALLDATEKAGSENVVGELGAMVGELFRKAPGFQQALASPRVTVPEKLALIDKTLGGRVSTELLRFMKVVCEHGRLDCLSSIYRSARAMLNEKKGVVEVQVVTAEPADRTTIDQVKRSLKEKLGAEVDVTSNVDPKLLGGILIRVGDKVYDGSVARKLEILRDQAVAQTVTQMREAGSKFSAES